MKAKELIKILKRTPEADVKAYDADAEEFVPVTGTLLIPGDTFTDPIIELQTDEP